MDSVEKLKSEEYEAHLFGFTSSDVIDGIRYTMTDYIKSATDAVKRSILKQEESKKNENEINDITNQLLNEYKRAANSAMKDLEAMCMETLLKKELSVLTTNIDAIEAKVAEMKTVLDAVEKERELCADREEVIKTVIDLKGIVKDL